MVSHLSDKFGGHRHCGSEDIMFLVAEKEYTKCSRFNLALLFISKGYGLKVHNIILAICFQCTFLSTP